MKKTLILLLAVFCVLLCACNEKTSDASEDSDRVTYSSSDLSGTMSDEDNSDFSSNPNVEKPINSSKDDEPIAHTHNFVDATCTAPQKCSCGDTKGSALGHSFTAANCTSPKKCTRCGKTEGSVSHSWNEATCSAPKTCKLCGKKEGVATAHNIDTKTSKCKICGAFELNIEYAIRGAVKYSAAEFVERFPNDDWHSIENIYYVLEEDCPCIQCMLEEEFNPFLTVFIVYSYSVGGVEDIFVDVLYTHEYFDKAADTHYQLGLYLGEYTYSYNRSTYGLNEIYASNYDWYYDSDDLTWIDKKKVV